MATKKPNFLILWGDDVGWWNISYNSRGQMGYRTPNIDRVANEGVAFTDYYAQQSCTAGRAAFMTGQNPIRTGLTKVGMPGATNGLQADCLGNALCYRFAKAHPKHYLFAACEVPDLPDAVQEIEKYLKLGGVAIAELKFGVECDSPDMQKLYELAADYRVPVLMHWQYKMFNYSFERFYIMLEKYPKTTFIGHAQTWWANIDKNHSDQSVLYPKGKVTPGGLTDRYLSDYPNMYGDLSAGSGLNAFTRDDGTPLMTPLVGVSLMVFFVLACQCTSTIAVVRRESGSWAWTAFMVGYMTALSYGAALAVRQVGLAAGFGP